MSASVPACWNRLDDRARAVALGLAEAMPVPLRELGVVEARRLTATRPAAVPITPLASVLAEDVGTRSGTLRARLYRREERGTVPVLMYLHGGGFVLGTLDGVDEACRAIADRSGWAVLSVEYRLAPEDPYPAALEDAIDAFVWLRGESARLGLASESIAVGGDSAGGNLAAALCLVQRDTGGPDPAAQVLVYPAVDNGFARRSWTEFADAPLLSTADARWCYESYMGSALVGDVGAAPMRAESLRGLPPALVITAEVDPIRDDAEAYARRLAEDGVAVTAVRYDGVFHGFFPEVGVFEQSGAAIDEVARFLRGIAR